MPKRATKTSFKKGQSGNPNGRPRLAEDEKLARDAARSEIAVLYKELKDLPVKELKKISRDENQPSVRAWFAAAIAKGIQSGDMSEAHRMYDRLLGKPKQQIESSGGLTIQINEK